MSELTRLSDPQELDPMIAASSAAPVLLFKHSLTCSISHAAYREFEKYLEARPADDSVQHYLIEIQNARPVSAEVAKRTGVRHESPQALVFSGGKVVWHASHWDIRKDSLEKAAADHS